MTSNNNDLRAQVARINPGDTVTVMVQHLNRPACPVGPGEAWESDYGNLFVGVACLRFSGGDPGCYITAVLSHEPAPKPRVTVEELDALPAYAVVDDGEGGLWPKREDDTWGGITGGVTSTDLLREYPDLAIVSYGALPKPEADQ